jgi:hypothetical protein
MPIKKQLPAKSGNTLNNVTKKVYQPAIPFDSTKKRPSAEVQTGYYLETPYITRDSFAFVPSLQALSNENSEEICKLGIETLSKMAMDDEVNSSIAIYLDSIFSQDAFFESPIADADHKDYDQARKIADEANDQKLGADFSWEQNCRTATKEFLIYGSSSLEHQFKYKDSKWRLDSLLINGVRDFQQVINNYGELTHILPTHIGRGGFYGYVSLFESKLTANSLLPTEKFTIFNYNPKGKDVRGQGIILPTYPTWFNKQTLLFEMSRYIKKFVPIIYGTVGEKATPIKVEGITKPLTATEALANELAKAQNGGILALPYGTELNALSVGKEASAFFVELLKLLNLQIARGITHQHLASGEGEHQARAASEVHQDILLMGIKAIKMFLTRMLRLGTLRQWTILNYGISKVHLTPNITFGQGSGLPLTVADIIEMHKTGFLTPEQYPQADRTAGLNVRKIEDVKEMFERSVKNNPEITDSTKDVATKSLKDLTDEQKTEKEENNEENNNND